MYFSVFTLILFIRQALAFSLTVGNGIMDVSNILDIPESPVKAFCNANCTDASASIAACDDNPMCLCNVDTVVTLLSCETCMLHFLIDQNVRAPDLRAGSNVIMGAYGAACEKQANVFLPTNFTSLSLPDSWDGPFVGVLPISAAIFYVTFGGILGISALYILSTLA